MKKTLTMLAILLTLCLAGSVAFAAAAKKVPVSLDETDKDPLVLKYNRNFLDCIENQVRLRAFEYATTSAFYEAVVSGSLKFCRLHKRMLHLRMCELIMSPMPICVNGKEMSNFINIEVERFVPVAIEFFDEGRIQKGLPPRPSIDK